MAMQVHYCQAADVCVDCAMLIASGDWDGFGDDRDRISEVLRSFDRYKGWGLTAHWSDGDEVEPWFSWRSCDLCGDRNGGDRLLAHYLVPLEVM